jgi:hypothetical protein
MVLSLLGVGAVERLDKRRPGGGDGVEHPVRSVSGRKPLNPDLQSLKF